MKQIERSFSNVYNKMCDLNIALEEFLRYLSHERDDAEIKAYARELNTLLDGLYSAGLDANVMAFGYPDKDI